MHPQTHPITKKCYNVEKVLPSLDARGEHNEKTLQKFLNDNLQFEGNPRDIICASAMTAMFSFLKTSKDVFDNLSAIVQLEQIRNFSIELNNRFYRLDKLIKTNQLIDTQNISEIEKIYFELLTKTTLKIYQINGVIGKQVLFKQLFDIYMGHSSPCYATVYTETSDVPELPEKTSIDIAVEVRGKPQDGKNPCAIAGDETLYGGTLSSGFVQEELAVLPSNLLLFADQAAQLESDCPIRVLYSASSDGSIRLEKNLDLSKSPIAISTQKWAEISQDIYSNILPVALAAEYPLVLDLMIKKINPHPFWLIDWAMPDLSKQNVMTKEIMRETLELIFRAVVLNLRSLKRDSEFKNSKEFQLVLSGTGIFRWPKEVVSVMLVLAANMAFAVTGITGFQAVIAAFTPIQKAEVDNALSKHLKMFKDLPIDQAIDELLSMFFTYKK
jgi:hypothetical protein